MDLPLKGKLALVSGSTVGIGLGARDSRYSVREPRSSRDADSR